MSTITNCATATLAPYVPSLEQPWNLERARHLYRRIGFGATIEQLDVALELSPQDLVDSLLDNALNQALPEPPEWATWSVSDYENFNDEFFQQYVDWMVQFMTSAQENGPLERLTIFWHNHFVTQFETYSCPSLMYTYHRLLQEYAFGDFKEFVLQIGETPAMLFFLNGFENTRFSPNENYARELFELFTLGENNGYTQQDIVEASRALTGWNGWTEFCAPIEWADWGFDPGPKTIFGRTGNWNHPGLIDVLFEERSNEIAQFICGKLYRYYVNPSMDQDIVNGLAQTFLANNFQIEPVLRQLFRSEHFFDESNFATIVKSPIDNILMFHREGSFPTFPEQMEWAFWAAAQLGMQLMEPPDVAGWPGDRSWINSARLTGRWQVNDGFIWNYNDQEERLWADLAQDLTGNSNSPEIIAQTLVDHFIAKGLPTQEDYDLATDVLKWDVPENYYTTGAWNLDWESADWQVLLLMRHIIRRPEFQLY
ncbi:MAG: DUF1800 domain-containing protein [Bacteroidota bacterium]